ncbi:MAG: hypothetical protein RSD95_10385 [Clostridia bacterium]
MSPRTGRPPKEDAKKSARIEIRLTPARAEKLKLCAARLGTSRAEVIERGIDMVDEATKK